MKGLLFGVILLLLLPFKSTSQDFSFTTDSSTYIPVTEGNTITSLTSFNTRIPIGFSFNFLNTQVDTFCLDPNGFYSFNIMKDHFISLFGIINIRQGNANSRITTKTQGDINNRVFIVQFENCYLNDWVNDSLNIQLKLHEATNQISIHVGSNTYSSYSSSTDPSTYLVGIIDRYRIKNDYVVFGNPDNPQFQKEMSGANLAFLTGFPKNLKRFIFSQVNN